MSKTLKTNNNKTSFPYPSLPRSPVLSERTYQNSNENFRPHPYHPNLNLTVFNADSANCSLAGSAKQTLKPSQVNSLYAPQSPSHNPALPSFNNYQLSSIAGRRETPSRRENMLKRSKKPALQLNLGEIDMGIEEFPEGPQTLDQRKFGNSHTPLESPTIKTLRGINEGIGLVIPAGSVRRISTRTKKIAFPSGFVNNQENLRKSLLKKEHVNFEGKRQAIETMKRTPMSRCKETLLDEGILKVVTGFLSCRDIICFQDILHEFRNERKYKKIFKDKMFRLMLNKLNDDEQYQFWDSLVDFKKIREEHPLAFTAQFVKECPYMKDILKDLDRTLPEYDKYSTFEGKEGLLKVLVALANTIKDVGYIQGLNSIAGVFLFYLNEEKSYWITLYMMEKLQMKNILHEDFNTVHVLNYQLKTFLDNYIPNVAGFLNKNGVDISNYTTCWFITFYSYFLTLPNTVKAWNFLFINGNSFLIQLGLAVFSRYREKILNMDVDDLGAFFKYDLREISADDNLLFEEAIQFHVSDRLMRDLEGYYKKGKPQLKLIKDFYNKLQWKPVVDDFSSVTSPSKKPKFHIDLSATKENPNNTARLSQSSETRRFGSPSSALEKGKDFVNNIVQTITIDLPEAIKTIFVKSPRNSETQRALSKFEPSENSQPSTQTSLQQVGSRALQPLDSNYDLRPTSHADAVINSMDLVLNKENRRNKCHTERKAKKNPSNRAINLTIATAETEENESFLHPAVAEKVRTSKEVSLVEIKNRLPSRRQNIGVNNNIKPRFVNENLQSPKIKPEDGFFSPKFHNRLNQH